MPRLHVVPRHARGRGSPVSRRPGNMRRQRGRGGCSSLLPCGLLRLPPRGRGGRRPDRKGQLARRRGREVLLLLCIQRGRRTSGLLLEEGGRRRRMRRGRVESRPGGDDGCAGELALAVAALDEPGAAPPGAAVEGRAPERPAAAARLTPLQASTRDKRTRADDEVHPAQNDGSKRHGRDLRWARVSDARKDQPNRADNKPPEEGNRNGASKGHREVVAHEAPKLGAQERVVDVIHDVKFGKQIGNHARQKDLRDAKYEHPNGHLPGRAGLHPYPAKCKSQHSRHEGEEEGPDEAAAAITPGDGIASLATTLHEVIRSRGRQTEQ